jgi:hypothetical protein
MTVNHNLQPPPVPAQLEGFGRAADLEDPVASPLEKKEAPNMLANLVRSVRAVVQSDNATEPYADRRVALAPVRALGRRHSLRRGRRGRPHPRAPVLAPRARRDRQLGVTSAGGDLCAKPEARTVLAWPKNCKLAHLAFLWGYSCKKLKLPQLLGQLGVSLT